MNCEFSEFQYGVSIFNEICNHKKFKIKGPFPFDMPSLRKEASIGYDLGLESFKPIFLQFKVPEYMIKSTAKQYNDFLSEFYRFEIRTKFTSSGKSQHSLLYDLSQTKNNLVYYVAPFYYSNDDFRNYHLKSQTCDKSLFKKLSNMKRYTNELTNHHICYRNKPHKVNIYSEPYTFEEVCDFNGFLGDLDNTDFMNNMEYFLSSINEVLKIDEFATINDIHSKIKAVQSELLSQNIFLIFTVPNK